MEASDKECEDCCNCKGSTEEIIDEELIHVEINGIFQDLFKSGGQDLASKFIGLDSEQPIVQIGNQVFAGTFEDTLGTSLFFTVDEKPTDQDDEEIPDLEKVFDNSPSKTVKYVCKSDKKLVLKRVFLTPK